MLEGNDMIFPDQVSDSRRVFRLDVNIFTDMARRMIPKNLRRM